MDLFLPLVSFILILGGQGSQHASFADAAKMTLTNMETLMAYWEAALPGIPIPPAISDLLAQQKGLSKIEPNYERVKSEAGHMDNHVHIISQVEDHLKEAHGSHGEQGIKKAMIAHEPNIAYKEISVSYGSKGQEISKEASGISGLKGEMDLKDISVSYGVDDHENLKEISVTYGSKDQETLKEPSGSYGLEGEKELKEISVSYAADGHENLKEISVSYGSKDQKIGKEASGSYGLKGERDLKEISVSYGVNGHEILKGGSTTQEENSKEATMSYGSVEEKDEQSHILNQVKGEGSHHHVHAHSYKNKKEADVFFFHDMLRPGSLVTPTIPPTTSMPALLPRDIADSIPFSTEHLSDIITMFAPASLTMTREIRWTMETCEHPRTLPGQKAGCATSLESLAELPASLLGRSNVRAFSAVDLPMDDPGKPALRGRYKVTAARKLSGSSSEVVTCHDLTFPYAVYYCHTSSPTAAYMVTLASVEEGASPATMEVMAVCHLDTSLWSPKNPFFELHNVRPGDVAVCHFLTKLSIIWVTVDEHADTL
ncbi:hypothetical protein VPH35_133046 [Triticum aestivum]